jgi:isocitrate/isopropylmalate dehydrogenase
MNAYKIAAIPGDGIGTEVVSAGVDVLHAIAKRAQMYCVLGAMLRIFMSSIMRFRSALTGFVMGCSCQLELH